jgi:hypothetical protein
VRGANTGTLLPEGLSRFAFRRLSEKQKRKTKNSAISACPVGPEDRTGATLR